MADTFNTQTPGLNSPLTNAAAIAPNDSEDISVTTRGIYLGMPGDVQVDLLDSGTVTLRNLVAGVVHPIRAKRVYATGTTATDIVGLY